MSRAPEVQDFNADYIITTENSPIYKDAQGPLEIVLSILTIMG